LPSRLQQGGPPLFLCLLTSDHGEHAKSTNVDVEVLIVEHEIQVQTIPNPIVNMIGNVIFLTNLLFAILMFRKNLHVNTKDYHVFKRFYTMSTENEYL